MKTVIIEQPGLEEKLRCVTPLSEADDRFQHIDSCDEESLPHMLSTNREEEEDNDIHAEFDAWPSPMTNSVKDDRTSSLRMIEMSSTSSISTHYPQSEAEYLTLNSLMDVMPRHHRNTNSCESVTITDEESESCAHRKGALKHHAIKARRMHLKPRLSRRSPSPSDSQNSSRHARHQSPAYNSNESNDACSSCDSSPQLKTRASLGTRFKHPRKDEQEPSISVNLRPPPSPTPSLLTNTRKQMLHRRSVSLDFPDRARGGLEEGERNGHVSQRGRKLPVRAHSLSSSLVHKRRHKVNTAHRRSVSFPNQVVQSHTHNNSSISYPSTTVHHHSLASQSNDPALFSLIGATMGGHHGRVSVSADVDPHLTHTLHAVSEDHFHTENEAMEINWNISVAEGGDVHGKAKKRNRKPSRRSRGGSRNTAEKAHHIRNEDSIHIVKRNEDEENTQNRIRDKLTAFIGKKSKTNFGQNRTPVDKVETKNSVRFHNEKLKHSTSTAAGKSLEEPIQSDCLRPTHMESIVEEEGT